MEIKNQYKGQIYKGPYTQDYDGCWLIKDSFGDFISVLKEQNETITAKFKGRNQKIYLGKVFIYTLVIINEKSYAKINFDEVITKFEEFYDSIE